MASKVPPDLAIVELGSFKGKSTSYLARGKASVFAIDQWDSVSGNPIYNDSKTFKEFLEITKGLNVTPLKGNTSEISKVWTRPIGLLFIDAGHGFDDVSQDYRSWSPFVQGYIAFHDYDPNCQDLKFNGVHKVVETILKPSGLWTDYEIVGSIFTARRK